MSDWNKTPKFVKIFIVLFLTVGIAWFIYSAIEIRKIRKEVEEHGIYAIATVTMVRADEIRGSRSINFETKISGKTYFFSERFGFSNEDYQMAKVGMQYKIKYLPKYLKENGLSEGAILYVDKPVLNYIKELDYKKE